MAATAFSAVSWTASEVLTLDKMQQFADNVQWLRDNTPTAMYTLPSGVKRSTGVKLVAGRALVTARAEDNAMVAVNFGNTFSVGCLPIVTIGIVNDFATKMYNRVSGPGDLLSPTHTGFQIYVMVANDQAKNDKIKKNMYVHYQAVGY